MFTSAESSQPRIAAAPGAIHHTVLSHGSPPDESIQVGNVCLGTLTYSVVDDTEWLSVSPMSGSSNGESDAILVSYPGVPELKAGLYSATITIAGNAINSPQHVTIQIRVQTVRPDFDGDGDVDQTDFAHLQNCLTGVNVPQLETACFDARLDVPDLDVDAEDLAILLNCFSGPDVLAEAGCAVLYP
jgi:hypothetical protein